MANAFNNPVEGFPAEGFGGQEPSATEPTTEQNPTPPEGQGVEPTATPAAPEGNAPAWQSEFKTPEEMYEALSKSRTSYDNIRPAFTKVTQELSDLRKKATTPANQGAATPAAQVQPQTPAPTPAATEVDPVNVIKNYINDAVNGAVAPMAEIKLQLDVQNMIQSNPDFVKMSPTVQKVFEEQPEIWNLKNPLQIAYDIAKGRSINTALGDVMEEAKQEVYGDKKLKVIGSGGKTPAAAPTKDLTEEEQIVANILDAGKRRSSIF